jgi:hypothetical protein
MMGNAKKHEHTTEDVRQGRVVLRKPWQKIVFGAGLIGSVLAPAIIAVIAAESDSALWLIVTVAASAGILTALAIALDSQSRDR